MTKSKKKSNKIDVKKIIKNEPALFYRTMIYSGIILFAIIVLSMVVYNIGQGKEEDVKYGAMITTLDSLNYLAPDKEVNLILLPGGTVKRTDDAVKKVKSFSEVLAKEGVTAGIFTLSQNSDQYAKLKRTIRVREFPVVLVICKKSDLFAVKDGISLRKLGVAYKYSLKTKKRRGNK